jgi:hypothetical protein
MIKTAAASLANTYQFLRNIAAKSALNPDAPFGDQWAGRVNRPPTGANAGGEQADRSV